MLDEQSFLDFTCPHCGEAVSFPQEDAGRPRACPSCTEALIVPTDGSPIGRTVPVPLKTERLALRRFASGDWKDLLAVMSDEESFRYTNDAPLEEESVLQWLEADQAVKLTTPGQWFFLGIELKEGGQLIGYVGLNRTEHEADLFIRLHREHQKQGLAFEAMGAVLGFCFDGIRVHRVTAVCDARHAAAARLFDRVGLRREAEFIKNKWAEGQWVNTLYFAALNEERQKASSAG